MGGVPRWRLGGWRLDGGVAMGNMGASRRRLGALGSSHALLTLTRLRRRHPGLGSAILGLADGLAGESGRRVEERRREAAGARSSSHTTTHPFNACALSHRMLLKASLSHTHMFVAVNTYKDLYLSTHSLTSSMMACLRSRPFLPVRDSVIFCSRLDLGMAEQRGGR